MLRVGIIGWGGMGTRHFSRYGRLKNAEVTAIADTQAERLCPGGGPVRTNLGANETGIDPERHRLYTDPQELIDDPGVDLVDICLPTFLHAEYMQKALRAGKHVLCEKPMAMSYAECRSVLEVAEQAPGKLMVAQCVRFFPAYEYLYETVRSGRLGRLLHLDMWRASTPPTWSWQNWLQKSDRSGGMILDLHVHDADFVHHLLGRPRAVCSTGAVGPTGGYDIVDTQYIYEQKMAVRAAANAAMPPPFGFEAGYRVAFERGSLRYEASDEHGVTETTGEGVRHPELSPIDGYEKEIAYFVHCILNDEGPAMAEPESSAFSVRLVEAEKESIETGRSVEL
ncbi:MAG: Gfo/Idh/MocA family oxidoreductase [Candidatus Brocadiaceae bacterium]|nr:Gfo/Idh/MocA family oxidoreductase [Candidatus Brocadiaceae bacterium]